MFLFFFFIIFFRQELKGGEDAGLTIRLYPRWAGAWGMGPISLRVRVGKSFAISWHFLALGWARES